MNLEPYSHVVAFLKVFCFSDTRFDGYKIETSFGKQGSLPLGFADANMHRDHSPAIGHQSRDRFQVAAVLRRNSNEEPGGGSLPEQNGTGKFNVHWHSISNAQ